MSCNTLLLVSVVLALVLFCGLSAYLLCQMLREWTLPREIGATFRGLSKTTVAVLALGAAVAVLQGGAKSRAPARHAPMAQSAPGDEGESSGRTGDPDDGGLCSAGELDAAADGHDDAARLSRRSGRGRLPRRPAEGGTLLRPVRRHVDLLVQPCPGDLGGAPCPAAGRRHPRRVSCRRVHLRTWMGWEWRDQEL